MTRYLTSFTPGWLCWLEEANKISEVQVSRPLITRQNTPVETSLQVFCDASEIAYAAVVYMRNVYGDNTIELSLVAAKTRVAPRRPTLTVPRLELNAAVLVARLAHKVDAALTSRVHKVDLWSDLTIVLRWLAQRTAVETKYVINRVTDILEALRELRCAKEEDSVTWRHVPTADNPSDDCTRGLRLRDMLPGQSCRYWHGADFPSQPRDTWPMGSSSQLYEISTLSSYNTWTTVTVEQETVFELERYSSYLRVSRVAAFVLRFIHNTKNKESEKNHGCLQVVKWHGGTRNICGDVVLLIESDSQRGLWPLCRMEAVHPGADDVVRVVNIRVGGTMLRRPVTKLSYICGPDENFLIDVML
jgi:hypothetical protein